MLTDKQRICDDIMLGLATPATGPFNRLGKQCDPNLKPVGYDPDAALALLKEAGYVNDGSGVLKGPDGKPFEFKLTYRSGSPVTDRIVLLLKDSYGRAGITLVPDRLDRAVMLDRLKARDFESISLGWTANLEGDIYQMFDSSQMSGDGEDFMAYKNPELDSLIETARATVDETKRIAMWRRCHDILNEDQPYTFLFTRRTTVFLDKRIHNVQKLPLGLNDLTEWFVPTGMQKYHD
jgi:peptide/nickel transport system substrate-binding protein